MKVAISGSSGLVGSRIIELLNSDFDFIPLKYEDGFDMTNKEIVWNALKDLNYDLLLHLAGYTFVDKAEEEKNKVWQINVDGTKNIFEAVKEKNKKIIYISTDYVFNGDRPNVFFNEDSKPDPIGTYALTKYEGEKIIGKNGMIVRISYPYRSSFEPKKDFARKIKDLLLDGGQIKGVEDSIITPTFIDDIAFGLKYLIKNYSDEIFHLVGSDCLSPYACAKLIATTFGLDESLIEPTTFEDYFKQNSKNRPQYTPMLSKKNNFHKMKTFEEGLKELSKNR